MSLYYYVDHTPSSERHQALTSVVIFHWIVPRVGDENSEKEWALFLSVDGLFLSPTATAATASSPVVGRGCA